MAAWSRRNYETLPIGPVCGSNNSLPEYHEKFFGKLLSKKSRQVKISNAMQGEPTRVGHQLVR